MKKQTNTQRLQNKIIKLQDEVNEMYVLAENEHKSIMRFIEAEKESSRVFNELRTLAANLCQQAIIYKSAPTLAKEFRGQDDAINQYLRYLMSESS